MLNTFIGWINQIAGAVMFFLPDDPLQPYIYGMAGAYWLGVLNWFIPFRSFFIIGGSWLAAITIFYVFKVILRWAKVIE
jgi:hypothetical protein